MARKKGSPSQKAAKKKDRRKRYELLGIAFQIWPRSQRKSVFGFTQPARFEKYLNTLWACEQRKRVTAVREFDRLFKNVEARVGTCGQPVSDRAKKDD